MSGKPINDRYTQELCSAGRWLTIKLWKCVAQISRKTGEFHTCAVSTGKLAYVIKMHGNRASFTETVLLGSYSTGLSATVRHFGTKQHTASQRTRKAPPSISRKAGSGMCLSDMAHFGWRVEFLNAVNVRNGCTKHRLV